MKTVKLYVLLLAIFSPFILTGQDFGELLKGSAADAKILLNGYASPALKVIGSGLNQGWYNTARPHKIAGVDLTISVAAVGIPDAEKLYEVDNTKLSTISLVNTHTGTAVPANGKAMVPTIFGPEKEPRYQEDISGETFNGPKGLALKENIGINRVPIPIAQLGFGLPKGTDIKFRFVPTLSLGDGGGKIGLFGIGVMHDVKQWIPVIKDLPFDLSGFVGFTKLKIDVEFDEPGQVGEFRSNATTIQGLISKKLAVLTVYGGLGYNISKTTVDVKGKYDFDDNGTVDATDPFSLEGSASGPRLTAGMRLKLAVFTFHGDYTIQKFSTLTVGFGINVR